MNQEEVARRIGVKFALEGMVEEQLDEYIRWFFATSFTQALLFEANNAYHNQLAADADDDAEDMKELVRLMSDPRTAQHERDHYERLWHKHYRAGGRM